MVKIENNLEDKIYRILLRPNQSSDWKSSLIFILIIAFTCLSIGIGFALAGATMILPFAGLEIILVYLAFRLSFNWSNQKQIIILCKDHVEIRVDGLKEFFTWKEFRSFATFNVIKNDMKDDDLSFRSKGKEIIVGSFLNEEDKSILKDEISRIIQKLNAMGFAS